MKLIKLIKKFIKKENFLPILIVLVFALLAGRTLLTPGYFNMHDDLQMMRQLEMEKCFKDLQIPCRWVPDMGYGFGFPLFNYYPPLPYLVGEIFRVIGFSFVDTVKVLFLISFLASGVAMYYLAKEFFGKIGGVVSAVFYIWAPYHAVDVYVRGAMNEAWALIWFPLIFWTGYRLITANRKKNINWMIGLALSWTALLVSHNLMVLIFTPVFGVWCLLWIWREKRWAKIWLLAGSGLLALGLSAFFTLPAFLEQKYVHVATLVQGYYEYIAHFVSISQLLWSRFWGFGPSVWELADKMPFQVGHLHWILSIVILVAWLISYLAKKKSIIRSSLFVIPFLFSIGWFAAFMAHVRSTPIWQALPLLKFVQFPWRFLTIVTFCFSFLAGAVVIFLKPFDKLRVIIPSFLVILLVIINWNYFLPEHGKMGALTDQEKFSAAAWDLQQTAGIFDYLPNGAKENPKEPQKILAEAMIGKAEVSQQQQGTNWAKFKVKVEDREATVRINIFDFPNWKAYVDGKEIKVSIPDTEKWGRMYFEVPQGEHEVYLKLYNTPVRNVANVASLITWVGLISFPFWRKKINA